MGRGYVYKCPKCGYEKELTTGIGFLTYLEADMEREKILAGFYGAKAQAALVKHPEAPMAVEWAMYQCRTCGKLESRLAVKIAGPVQVCIHQQCDCGATMHRIRNGEEMFCPTCQEPLKKTDIVTIIMWD